MRYALIGCGRVARLHINAAIASGLDIVALCDIDDKRANKFINDHELENTKVYTDYLKMIEEEQLDLVSIASPSYLHYQMGMDIMDKGINVIIEKPIALSISDANNLIAKAKEKNVLACANHQNRFNKSIRYMRKALEEGKFGKLLHGVTTTSWYRSKEYYLGDPWRGKWDQDGGSLMTQSIHGIDLLIWMFGDVDEVFSYVDNLDHPYIETDDIGLALIKFKNGAYGVIQGVSYAKPRDLEETLYIFGDKGVAKAAGRSDNLIEFWRFIDDVNSENEVTNTFKEVPPNAYGYGHLLLYKDVVNAIKGKRNPQITLEEGKKAVEVILAMLESTKTKKPVKLPLKSNKTSDYKGLINK